ncbi:MAG: GNAT family N-acetyltransferase [Anaerolineae bacterium]|jgi:CelD/BcsL family acetyltransferase involved in cellulose biosynthesis|nr:GNAT family N-acetyltransferase [Anaerolineae bacterium]MDH7472551.1 GNAT family N-acetyltransferase [Anaerolineae bacterium]
MKLDLYQDVTGFATLAGEWNTLLHRSDSDTVFLTHEWQSTWWRFFASGRELLLLALRQDDQLVGIAPFYRQRLADGQTVIQLIGGTEISDYLDIIALPDYRDHIYQTIFEFLTAEMTDWDKIDLHCIPAATPYEPLREAAQKRGLAVQRHVEDVCPVIPLPATWDDYLVMLDKKQRHELRRKLRRAEQEADVQWYMTSDSGQLAEDMGTFFALHRQSSPDKEDFMSEPAMQGFFHEVARFSLAQGWLELSFLLINGEKAASMFCFAYNNRTLVYNSGYDPQRFGSLSPGIVLLAYHIRDSIAKGRAAFDFLRGDEVYKYRFGGQNTEVFQITVRRGF